MADIQINHRSENITTGRPAGKGAPVVITDQYNHGHVKKRSAAVKARDRIKECFKVYRNYIHGWDHKVNQELESEDQFNFGYMKEEATDELGIVNDQEQVNELVRNYQAFLNRANQSEDSSEDEGNSLWPNPNTVSNALKTSENDSEDESATSPDLFVPSGTLEASLGQFKFNLEAEVKLLHSVRL